MVEFCIKDAVLEYHKHLIIGRHPHIIWTNGHAYVITEEDFPANIHCHDGDLRTTSGLIQKILENPYSREYGSVKDELYKLFIDQVILARP